MLRQSRAIKEHGTFFGTVSAGRALPAVTTRDIAAIAARLLLDSTWTGQEEVPMLGPEDLSHNDMAAIAAEVLGTPVRHQQIPLHAFKDQLTGSGGSEAMAQGMLDMMIAKDNGLDNGVVRTAEPRIDPPAHDYLWTGSSCWRTCRPPE